jgi:guanosine-3',5'-bis(diphosphate) 3'-pyrophosphohydrolase
MSGESDRVSAAAPFWHAAVSFAARAHAGQMRKDGVTPYAAHVVRVAMTLRDEFGCTDQAALCGALLHDTIEDTPTDYDDIENRFGTLVADTVAAMTKNMLLREDDRERDYDARLASGPWQARIIKLADTLDNARDVPQGTDTSAPKAAARCRRAVALARADASRVDVQRGIALAEAAADSLEKHGRIG